MKSDYHTRNIFNKDYILRVMVDLLIMAKMPVIKVTEDGYCIEYRWTDKKYEEHLVIEYSGADFRLFKRLRLYKQVKFGSRGEGLKGLGRMGE